MEALLNEVLQPALHQPFALPPPALPAQYHPHLQSHFATAQHPPAQPPFTLPPPTLPAQYHPHLQSHFATPARRHTYSSSSPFLSSDELKRVFDSPPSSQPSSGKRLKGVSLSEQYDIYKNQLKKAVNNNDKLDAETWIKIHDFYKKNGFKQDKEFENYLEATDSRDWEKFLNFDNAFGISYKYKKYTDFMRKHKHVRAWLSKVKSASHYKQKLRHVRSLIRI